jgi:hypothetical protein
MAAVERGLSPETNGFHTEHSETVACIERHLWYNEENSQKILDTHKAIAKKYNVANPYFLFTDKLKIYSRFTLDQGAVVKAGSVGAFTNLEIARILNEQTYNYIAMGTMGPNFPANDPQAVEQLLAIMIGGFDANRVVTLVEVPNQEGVNPVASVQAHYGRSSLPFHQTLRHPWKGENENDSTFSTLATFQSLQIVGESEEFRQFLQTYGHLPERNVVCMSRLYRQNDATLQELNYDARGLAWKVMGFLGIALDRQAKLPQDRASIVVYDTHSEEIQTRLSSYFGMQVIAQKNEVVPTDEVLNTILHYHYGTAGFMDDIRIGYAPLSEYTRKAEIFLASHGISMTASRY